MKTRYLSLLLVLSCKLALADPNNEAHISIKQLEARISTLEDLLQELQAKQGNPSQVKAPFEVVDQEGKPLLKVTNNNGSTLLLLSSQNTQNTVVIATGNIDSRIVLQSDANHAILKANTDGSSLSISNADVATVLGSGDDGRDGLVIKIPGVLPENPDSAGGGQMSAEISTQTGKKLALRISDDKGNTVVSAGSNSAAAGSGTVRVANIKGENVAFMGTTSEGENGAMGVAKGGKDVVAIMSEPRLVAVYNDMGAPIVSMGKSDKSDGGNLTTRDPTGDGVFSAGYNSAVGGGDACVYREKRKNTFCLGIGLPGMMGTMGN